MEEEAEAEAKAEAVETELEVVEAQALRNQLMYMSPLHVKPQGFQAAQIPKSRLSKSELIEFKHLFTKV